MPSQRAVLLLSETSPYKSVDLKILLFLLVVCSTTRLQRQLNVEPKKQIAT